MQTIKAKLLCFIQHTYDFTPVNRRFELAFFITVFAFLFANFFEPFGIHYEYGRTIMKIFVDLFVAMSFAFIVIIVSQFVVRPLIKIYRQNIWITYVWFLFEGIVCATIWTILQITVEISNVPGVSVLSLWFENLVAYTALIAMPYLLYLFYLYHNDRLALLKTSLEEKDKELQNVAILDETGETKLLLHIDNFLFASSADNYVEINYVEGKQLHKILIRNSLKNIENSLHNSPIMRCHRSYILNTIKVESAKKTTSGFDVKLQNISNIIIPVSKSYVSELKKHIDVSA